MTRLNETTTFSYTGGRLSEIRPPDGQPGATVPGWTFGYDAANKLRTVVGPSIDQNASTRIDTITIASGRLLSIKDPDGFSTKFDYSGLANLITGVTSRDSLIVSAYHYDATMKLDSAWVDPGMNQSVIAPAIATREARSLAPHTLDPADAYTEFKGPRAIEDNTKFWLDRYGQVLKIENALQQQTIVSRGDPRFPALVTEVTLPNGYTQRATYTPRGQIATSTEVQPYGPNDTRNAPTRYEYTNAAWPDFVTRIVRPERDSVVMEYDPTGNRIYQEDGRGSSSRTEFGYYPNGQIAAVKRPLTPADSLKYDSRGNLRQTKSPRGFVTNYYTDSVGRNTLVVSPIDSTPTDSTHRRYTTTSYTLMDQVKVVVDSGPEMADSNAVAERMTVVNEYTPTGNLASVTRFVSPDGGIGNVVNRWRYDRAGRKIAEVASDTMVDSTHYDAAGNVDMLSTRRQHTVTMTYDLLNRLVTRTLPAVTYSHDSSAMYGLTWGITSYKYPRESLGASADTVVDGDTAIFAYDDGGRVTAARNSSAYVGRAYFPNGLIAAETLMVRTYDRADSTMHTYVTQYEYDLNGRRRFVHHPAQLVADAASGATEYVYDPQTGALATVRDVLGNEYGYWYDNESRLTGMTAPGGVHRTMQYDDDGRLWHDQLFDPSNILLRNTVLAYDGRDKMVKSDNAAGALDHFVARYSGLGNVRSTTYSDGTSGVGYTANETFSVDALGNTYSSNQKSNTTYRGGGGWLSGGGQTATVSYAFNSFEAGTGRLIRHSLYGGADAPDTAVVSYNAAGQMERDFTVAPTVTSTGTQTFNDRALYYNALGQLVATDTRTAILPPAPSEANTRFTFEEYRYDALGRRVLTRMRRQCHPMLANESLDATCPLNTIRRTVWDGDSELDEIQMPDLASEMENDTASVPLQLRWAPDSPGHQSLHDYTPFFGRVAYTNGLALDAPLGIIRFHHQLATGLNLTDSTVFPPTTLALHWNARGRIDNWSFADGQANYCLSGVSTPNNCFRIGLNPGATVYQQQRTNVSSWMGASLDAKVDGSGLLYRRNRYLDPMTGRFTQEDPIGLAGGLNLYGFAGGDPVSYSDPFGLSGCKKDEPCDDVDQMRAIVDFFGKVNNAVTFGWLFGTLTNAASGLGVASEGGIANPVPATLARVIPAGRNAVTLARAGEAEAFVTDAAAIEGLSYSQVQTRLGIDPSSTGYEVIKFSTRAASSIASPINRTNPLFVGRGQTIGGLPEFVIPNMRIPADATRTIIKP